jgi:hypothetical protein
MTDSRCSQCSNSKSLRSNEVERGGGGSQVADAVEKAYTAEAGWVLYRGVNEKRTLRVVRIGINASTW